MALSSAIRAGRAFVEISTRDMFSKTLGKIQQKLFKFARVATLAGIALAGIGGVAIGGAVKLLSDFLEKSDSPAAKTLGASVAKASEAFGRLKMAIGEALAPLATKLLDFATPFIESAASMILNWDQTVASIELAWLDFKGRWIGSTENMAATFKTSFAAISELAKSAFGSTATAATEANATIAADAKKTGITLNDLWYGFQSGSVAVANAVRAGWIKFTTGLKSAWTFFVGYIKSSWNQAAIMVVKSLAWVLDSAKAAQDSLGLDLGFTGSGGAGSIIQKLEDNQIKIAKETRDQMVAIAKDEAKSIETIKRDHVRTLAGIANEAKAEAMRASISDRERMLELEHYAQHKRRQITPQGGIALPAGIGGAGGGGGQSIGTFSGAAAARLGGAGGGVERMVKETAKTNKQLATTNMKLDTINASIEDGSVF